jgi:glycosyltransferase involved in cell wall biosynthesis
MNAQTDLPDSEVMQAPSGHGRRLLIITPCRDEAQFVEKTLESVASQTLLPTRWIIVDDGSTDGTVEIVKAAQRRWPFVHLLQRKDRGRRLVGSGVVDTFYEGLESVDLGSFDYVCKLDADLILPPRYFELVIERFEADPLLGTFSGKTYVPLGGRLVSERLGDENSIGPAKCYRVPCFQEIGGFVREVSWDGIDGHRCRQLGWVACSNDDPELRIVHLRQMGSSHKSIWTGRLRWGRGKYFMGSSLLYVLAASLYRMFEPPYVLGGFGILLGYLRAAVRREPRMEDEGCRRFLRRYELESLILGKRRVTDKYHRRIRRRKAHLASDRS